ncbi:hypothetical protein EZS27_015280 [termite gut metagenome]|uniref:Uncharacterized protein n=1 Tax=termite gut metagenome TaxID=433724 RepID=A0A5J4RSM6_9ZZZZ
MKQNVLKYLFFGIFIGTLSIIFTNCKDNDDDIDALQLTQQELKAILDGLSTKLDATTVELTALKGQVSTAVDTKITELLADVAALKSQLNATQVDQIKEIIEDYLKLEGGLTALADQAAGFQIKLDKVSIEDLAALANISQVDLPGFTTLAALLVKYQSSITELELQIKTLDGYTTAGSVKGAIDAVKTELDTNLATIKAALFDWDDAETKTLAEYLNTYDYATKSDLAAAITEALGEDALILKLKSIITGISLVKVDNGDFTLPLYTSIPADSTFGVGTGNTISFKAGLTQATTPQSFIVQVTPANVNLKDYKLSFVNSLGGQVEPKISVVPYNKLLTRAETGLFEITVEWNTEAAKADSAAKVGLDKGKNIRYALSVDKTSAEGRTILTEYDILFTKVDDAIHNDGESGNEADVVLNFQVVVGSAASGTSVADIKNRNGSYKDLKWAGTESTYVLPGITDEDSNDSRSTGDLAVNLGQSITVKLEGAAKEKALAYYVALETKARSGATNADTIAWKALVAGDLNKVTDVKENVDIYIKNNETSFGNLSPSKEVGFRLFAVNVDGTLVDPDGRAFYIKLTNTPVPIGFTATIDDVIPTATTGVAFAPSENVSFIKNLDSKTRAKITSVTITPVSTLKFVGGATTGATTLTVNPLTTVAGTGGAPATTAVTKWDAADLDQISIDGLVIPSSFGIEGEGDATAAAKIIVKGEGTDTIGTYPVTLTRKVELKVFDELTGTHSLYLLPAGEGKATADLGPLFGGITIDPSHLIVSIANNGDAAVPVISTTTGSPLTLAIDKTDIVTALSTTYDKVTVKYNYGYIYTDQSATNTELEVELANFSIEFLTELQSVTWNLNTAVDWTPAKGKLIYNQTNTISLSAFTARFNSIDYILVGEQPEVSLSDATRAYTLKSASLKTGLTPIANLYYTITISPEGDTLVFTPKAGQALIPGGDTILELTIVDVVGEIERTVEVRGIILGTD